MVWDGAVGGECSRLLFWAGFVEKICHKGSKVKTIGENRVQVINESCTQSSFLLGANQTMKRKLFQRLMALVKCDGLHFQLKRLLFNHLLVIERGCTRLPQSNAELRCGSISL